jgi:hypothetical protein
MAIAGDSIRRAKRIFLCNLKEVFRNGDFQDFLSFYHRGVHATRLGNGQWCREATKFEIHHKNFYLKCFFY